jgi:hypothetical protein
LVRDTENSLLFNHTSRVYYFAAAIGKRKGLTFDPGREDADWAGFAREVSEGAGL